MSINTKKRLVPVCGYKGGKRRWSRQIADHLLSCSAEPVYDVGAGSGAVSLSLIEAGLQPNNLIMIDSGPWGEFWKSGVTGELDTDLIERMLLHDRPEDPRQVREWVMNEVAQTYSPESFLILQAASYGSIPVWHDGQSWIRGDAGRSRGYSARGYWEPGPNSPETKPRPTIFTPEKIIDRLHAALDALHGCTVLHQCAESVEFSPGVVYVDPPYVGTSGYQSHMDVQHIRQRTTGPFFCSEQSVQGSPDKVHVLGPRKRGALRGVQKRQKDELLLEWEQS
tara:strand:- start:956 stop:1798 length:843 start_codon:yes stop_codon:yes gene_type:complete